LWCVMGLEGEVDLEELDDVELMSRYESVRSEFVRLNHELELEALGIKKLIIQTINYIQGYLPTYDIDIRKHFDEKPLNNPLGFEVYIYLPRELYLRHIRLRKELEEIERILRERNIRIH